MSLPPIKQSVVVIVIGSASFYLCFGSLWNCRRVESMDELNTVVEGKIVWNPHTQLSLTV